jgi:hypothetical protein
MYSLVFLLMGLGAPVVFELAIGARPRDRPFREWNAGRTRQARQCKADRPACGGKRNHKGIQAAVFGVIPPVSGCKA